jgi:hypothetical protein
MQGAMYRFGRQILQNAYDSKNAVDCRESANFKI